MFPALTRNSPPKGAPELPYLWPTKTSESGTLVQTTTKSPFESDATAGYLWSFDVNELTRNSEPTGAPELANRCPKTLSNELSWNALSHTTTKRPEESEATWGRSWMLLV